MPFSSNPFTYLPIDVCSDLALPDFPLCQDDARYTQLQSEICGLLIQPQGATIPTDWYNFVSWEAITDNWDSEKVHYLVGRGSFLPSEKELVSLAGGRVLENRERTYRLTLSIVNLDYQHRAFGRMLQANKKDFSFWLQKVGGTSVEGTVIGGEYGMRPIYVDVDFPFAQGKESRETMNITIDTEFLWFPEW